jgi:hypothetical protein
VACIAVVLAGASRKVGSQLAALFLQTLLLFTQPEIHVVRLCAMELTDFRDL